MPVGVGSEGGGWEKEGTKKKKKKAGKSPPLSQTPRTLTKALDDSTVLLGVFDGHGGKEVALYIAKHISRFVLKTAEYEKGELGGALIAAFLGIDQEILTEKAVVELKELGEGGEVRRR